LRAERPQDIRFALVLAVGAAGVGAFFGLAFGSRGALAGLAAGVVVGLVLVRRAYARVRRRRDAIARPFPAEWRKLLLERYDHYERMDAAWRARFEDDLRLFLVETRITGIGVEVTDELRLLVAASAVTLSVGWPEYEWEQIAEVLIYPDDFDRDYVIAGQGAVSGDEDAGRAHPEGTVILSAPSLEESFAVPDDAYHVGIHEFTHMLARGRSEGGLEIGALPQGLAPGREREWASIAEEEMERLRSRKRSAFDEYGADDPGEFLGVAVEAFFEIPQVVRRRHPRVYQILSEYFRQDPAAWDDARGLDE
jgi:Mlc titration factor MtfA (ptsG expression regulator)